MTHRMGGWCPFWLAISLPLNMGAYQMVQVSGKSFTLEEFLKLPETKPASEYIDGQILQKPMPQGKFLI